MPPLLLETCLGVATSLLSTAPADHPDWVDAVSLLALVQTHPASPRELQQRATEQLDGIAPAPTPPHAVDLAAAVAVARAAVAGWADEGAVPATAPSPAEPGAAPDWLEPLTPRELDVLLLLEQGRTNREIAAELVLTLGTVKWYTSQIYSKLAVANRGEAVHAARRYGLLA